MPEFISNGDDNSYFDVFEFIPHRAALTSAVIASCDSSHCNPSYCQVHYSILPSRDKCTESQLPIAGSALKFTEYCRCQIFDPTCSIAGELPSSASHTLKAKLLDFSYLFILYIFVSAIHLCRRFLQAHLRLTNMACASRCNKWTLWVKLRTMYYITSVLCNICYVNFQRRIRYLNPSFCRFGGQNRALRSCACRDTGDSVPGGVGHLPACRLHCSDRCCSASALCTSLPAIVCCKAPAAPLPR